MEHGARQNTTRVIAVGFISLGTLLTLSLATNIIQGINNYRLQTEQKVAVDTDVIPCTLCGVSEPG